MLCNSTSLPEDLYSPLGRGCRRANSPLPFGNEFDAKGVVACRVGFNVGMGMVPMLGCASCEDSVARRLNAELLLRKCLWYSSWSLRPEKKLAFDAVMGVLGVLAVRFGGGVTLRSSTSADGAGKDDIRLLKGVPSGSKFNGGSLIGWRFFLLDGCTVGVLSCSDPAPTVRPLLCLMDPVLLLAGLAPRLSLCRGPARWESGVATDSWAGGGAILVFDVGVLNWKLLRSGSLGDSYAFGIAGTGGTYSCSPPVELCTFRGFGAGNRELEGAGLPRRGIEEVPTFSEFKLEFDESEMPEAYDLRFSSGVARADDGVMFPPTGIAGDSLNARSSNVWSPWGVGGPTGMPGGG
jgi:hypothetical protein